MRFIVDNFPAASKWEQNISFTKIRCKGKHQRQNKDYLFQSWLFKIIEFRFVSPFKYYVLKTDFCGFCTWALSFQHLFSFWMSKCGDSPLEAGHMPNNAPGTEHPWRAGSDVSWWSRSLILLMGCGEGKSGSQINAQEDVQWWTQVGGQENCLLIAVKAVRSLTLKGFGFFWLYQRKQLMYGWNTTASTRNASVQGLWDPSM